MHFHNQKINIRNINLKWAKTDMKLGALSVDFVKKNTNHLQPLNQIFSKSLIDPILIWRERKERKEKMFCGLIRMVSKAWNAGSDEKWEIWGMEAKNGMSSLSYKIPNLSLPVNLVDRPKIFSTSSFLSVTLAHHLQQNFKSRLDASVYFTSIFPYLDVFWAQA